MQPRRPQRPALWLSLWLLLNLALPAAAVAPWDREHTNVPTRPPAEGLPRGILQRAAHAAMHFFNFRAASPSALRVLAAVQEGRARVSGPRCGGTRAVTAVQILLLLEGRGVLKRRLCLSDISEARHTLHAIAS